MSSPRSRWWSTARRCVDDYPQLKVQHDLLHEALGAADMSGMPRGGGASRSTENIALRTMSREDELAYDAVTCAINHTMQLTDGEKRIELIRLTHWSNRRMTVEGAGRLIGWASASAKRKHSDFIWVVVKYLQNQR